MPHRHFQDVRLLQLTVAGWVLLHALKHQGLEVVEAAVDPLTALLLHQRLVALSGVYLGQNVLLSLVAARRRVHGGAHRINR